MPEGERRLDLDPGHLAAVRQILGSLVPEHEVWAFGSRVTGGSRPFSDLDLVVVAPAPLTASRLSALRDAFADSDLPIHVDIVDGASTDPALRRIIEANRVLLQARCD